MNSIEKCVLILLSESPKTWRELSRSFVDKVELSMAIMNLNDLGMVRFPLGGDYYEFVRP
jgi:predicted transcriptional regulator